MKKQYFQPTVSVDLSLQEDILTLSVSTVSNDITGDSWSNFISSL